MTAAVPPPTTKRVIISRNLLWGSFIAGVGVNVVEVYWVVFAMREMLGGSCTAAFTGLLFGLPLVPISPILFGIGTILTKRSCPTACKAGLAGLYMSLFAFPFWLVIGFSVALAMGFG